MSQQDRANREDIFSKSLRAGRRTYFFDVRSTRAGDYYLTITESKRHTSDSGDVFYRKHKLYLYKEDFDAFRENLAEATDFIIAEKGTEVISDKHQPGFGENSGDGQGEKSAQNGIPRSEGKNPGEERFTDVDFDDI